MSDNRYIKAVAAASASRSTATLMKTGQTTSYRTGDDGDIEAGRATSFLVLDVAPTHNNGAATLNTTTNRFTDELGGQTYANNIVLDWATWNGTNLLGYRRTLNGSNVTWENAIDGALAVSIGTFTTGWRLANKKELENIQNIGLASSDLFNYSPFNINITSLSLWCSNTLGVNTSYAWRFGIYGTCDYQPKTTVFRYIPVRTFSLSTSNVLS